MSLSTDTAATAKPPMGAPLSLRKLHPAIGAEVQGLDLSQPLDPATFASVQQAWYDHNILLFRDQKLSADQQTAFVKNFGPLANVVSISAANGTGTRGAIMLVSNIKENGKPIGDLPDGEMWFHSDQCYIETPCAGSALYAIEIPSKGGNTMFANCYAAYDALSPQMKARLEGLKAVHAYDYSLNATRKASRPSLVPEGVRYYAHPVVRTHPETKRKALYINRLMTAYIEGMPEAESNALLTELFDHQEQRQFVYEHVWRLGDLLMWDNRCTLHARTDFDPAERRLLRRVTVLGDKPF